MRKCLLFFFFLAIFVSSSIGQDIQIFDDQNVLIPNNSVIQVYGNPTDNQLKTRLWLKNAAVNDISLSVTKEVLLQTEGSSNSFYWESYIEQNESPSYSLFLSANQINKEFAALYSPNLYRGISEVRYTFYDVNNPQISSSVTIEFITNNSRSSIERKAEFSLSDAYPNPAKSVVYFDYTLQDNILEAKITIRNLLGSTVSEVNLEGSQGKASINVEDLAKGIYFYSLYVDSETRPKFTKKLLIVRE